MAKDIQKDGRKVAQDNEVRLLRALHRCGWLPTQLLAVIGWQPWRRAPCGAPDLRAPVATQSNLRMAQRTLRRLYEARQVLRGRGPDGSIVYALSERGARRLQQLGVPAVSGKDMLRFSASQFLHRSIANAVFVSGLVTGFRCSSEHEIAVGRWPGGAQGIARKKPDVLLRDGERIYWIEIERSRRNARDYAKLLAWLGKVASTPPGPGLRWARIIFICTQAFEARLRRDLAAVGWQASAVDALLCFETTLYGFVDRLFVMKD